MRTIWKYQLLPDETLTISGGARLLVRHVGADPSANPELPSVWVELDVNDPQVEQEDLMLVFVGTGQPIPEGIHVGSCITVGGFVWHVFGTRRIHE
jgi:hypothetical protein